MRARDLTPFLTLLALLGATSPAAADPFDWTVATSTRTPVDVPPAGATALALRLGHDYNGWSHYRIGLVAELTLADGTVLEQTLADELCGDSSWSVAFEADTVLAVHGRCGDDDAAEPAITVLSWRWDETSRRFTGPTSTRLAP